MLFRRKKEMQSLINARTKALRNAEDKILQREKMIDNQKDQINDLKKQLEESDKNNEELVDILTEINKRTASNSYSKPEVVLKKIKELVKDFEANY